MGPRGLVVVACLAGIALRCAFLDVPRRTPDEMFYAGYAAAVVERGPSYVVDLVHLYRDDESLRQYPSPTRVASLWLIAGFMRLRGDTSVAAAAELSALASILGLIGLATLGLRFLPGWGAAVATVFLALSPLDLAIARRAWQDGVFALFALAMLFATLEFRERPRAAWAVVFFSLGSWASLIKESGLLLIALGSVAMALAVRRDARAVVAIFAGAALASTAALGVLVAVSGGFGPLGETITLALAGAPVNEYMRLYQTGSPLYYVRGLALTQPVPFALGFLAAGLVALRAPLLWKPLPAGTRSVVTVLAGYVLVYTAIACVHAQKNLRFLSTIYGPVYLLAGTLVAATVARLGPTRRMVGVVAAVLLASALWDLWRFHDLFIVRGVPDLATPLFTIIRR